MKASKSIMKLTIVFCIILAPAAFGVGVCAIAGEVVTLIDFPFRMMWFCPLIGVLGVLIVGLTAAMISVRPVLSLEPAVVFSGR